MKTIWKINIKITCILLFSILLSAFALANSAPALDYAAESQKNKVLNSYGLKMEHMV